MSLTEEVLEKIHLYPGIVDTHTHLIMLETKDLDWEILIGKCIENGLEMAMDIGTNTATFPKRLEMCSRFPQLYLTDGLSVGKSELPDNEMNEALSLLEKQIQDNLDNPRLLAVGEIGLDNFYVYGGAEKQKRLFTSQMEIADRFNLPVVIHNRDADKEVYDILSSFRLSRGGIIHCFSSNYEYAKKFIDLGYCISFSGNVTYKKSEQIADAAARIPSDSILAETDAPFLTPQKVRKYPNWSGFVGYTYDYLAELRGCTPQEMTDTVRTNFRKLMQI